MTRAPTCPDPRALAALLDGRLPLPEVDRLASHLEQCPDCARLADRHGSSDSLAGLVRGQAPDGPLACDPVIDSLIDTLRGLTPPSLPTGLRPAPETLADITAGFGPPAEMAELGQVGGYRVLSRLGAGGMGAVYLARQARPDRPVALKVFATGPRTRPELVARFRAEAEVAARLTHPNIVPVYEAGQHGGLLFIAMELAPGGNLARRLADAPLPPRDAARLIASVARAVAFAHSQGVVHRDLKPSNILLTNAECGVRNAESEPEAGGSGLHSAFRIPHSAIPKVADFGLAKVLAPDPDADPAGRTETGALLGTPAYMAPEQATGAGNVGPAADIYGLGAVLYECLTGRPPFRAATALDTLEQVRTQDPIPPGRLQPGVPRDLQTIALKCLEKDPARRYATAADLADDLDRFVRGEAVSARPVGIARRVAKWARRRPTAAALVVACGLSVAVLVAVVLVYTARLRDSATVARDSATEADRQRGQAANNYRSARSALRRMIGRLNDRRAAEVPGLRQLRQHQLEDALAFYEGVLAGADDPDPEVRLDAALAGAEVGNIQYSLGRTDAARDSFRRAAAILEQLPPESRSRPECRLGLIECYNHLANLVGGRTDESERYFLASHAEAAELVRADPSDPVRQNHVARTEHNLGNLFQSSGRLDRAVPHYHRAVETRNALIALHPHTEGYRADLAETLLNLGLIYLATGRAGESADAFQRADELLAPLVEAHPAEDRYGLSLAGVNNNWVHLLRSRGDLPGAKAKADRAVELADAVLARDRKYTVARTRSLQAHGVRALLFDQLGRFAAAAADYDHVVELAADPAARLGYRVDRAQLLARAGMHARAAAEALDLARTPGVSDISLYALACVLALGVEPARSDPAGALVGAAAAEARATAAVGLLRQLWTRGYFRPPERAKFLREDSDLNSLRDRPDFRRLLIDASGGPKS